MSNSYIPRFVFARYNESVKWILYSSDIANNAIIYNKGGDNIDIDEKDIKEHNIQIIPRPNKPIFGREGETYLSHIIDNYEHLDEYTVFSQADPFTHNIHFIETIECLKSRFKNFQPLTSSWKIEEDVPPITHILYDTTNNCENYSIFMQTLDSNLRPIGFTDRGIEIMLTSFTRKYGIENNQLLKYLYSRLNIKKPYCGHILFNYGAIFGVSKEKILSNPKIFYKNLRNFVNEDKIHGFIVERLWYTIFS